MSQLRRNTSWGRESKRLDLWNFLLHAYSKVHAAEKCIKVILPAAAAAAAPLVVRQETRRRNLSSRLSLSSLFIPSLFFFSSAPRFDHAN